MGKTLIMRLAAGAAGGTLALAAVTPALAHDEPAEGFNAVLATQHHSVTVDSDDLPDCAEVKEQSPGLIMDGFEVWVFNIPGGQFDENDDPLASIQFDSGTIDIPGYPHFAIGPQGNPHNLAVAVPAGSTLLDGDFNVASARNQDVVVTHTCPGTPDDGNGEPTPSPTPSLPGEDGDDGDNGEGGEDGDDDQLPVTGLRAGGLVALGAGLLAAGVAMLFVRQRRNPAGLVDGTDG